MQIKNRLINILSDYRYMVGLWVVLAVAASVQSLLSSPTVTPELVLMKYNNYVIFKSSFFHLLQGKDLYVAWPAEHWDLFKYSPAFAVFFGLFAWLPDWLGLTLWNLLNALVLAWAVYLLPRLTPLQKGLVLLMVSVELMTSLQNEQSNGLVAGLLVMSFSMFEREKTAWAALCLVFSVFVKLFGVVGFVMFLFYPRKGRFILYSTVFALLFLLMPLVFIGIEQYEALMRSWVVMLANDHSASYGLSAMGIFHAVTGVEGVKNSMVLVAAVVFLLPLARLSSWHEARFRMLMLVSVLLWVVVFNHKAESPTFVIAFTGAALWYITSSRSGWETALFVAALLLTSLSPTDVFPAVVRREVVVPYALKALPCLLIWLVVVWEMAAPGKKIQFKPNN
jgi:hypothetical protein